MWWFLFYVHGLQLGSLTLPLLPVHPVWPDKPESLISLTLCFRSAQWHRGDWQRCLQRSRWVRVTSAQSQTDRFEAATAENGHVSFFFPRDSNVGSEEAIDWVETQTAESHLCASQPIKTMTSWRLILLLPAHARLREKKKKSRMVQSFFDPSGPNIDVILELSESEREPEEAEVIKRSQLQRESCVKSVGSSSSESFSVGIKILLKPLNLTSTLKTLLFMISCQVLMETKHRAKREGILD